jgi:branched-chain amino acid transport system permease protein
MLSLIGQLFVDGLSSGLVYVILALGFVFIMSVSRIFFIAYGQFYMIGAYTVWYAVTQFHIPYFLSLMIGTVVTAIMGVFCYILIFQYIERVAWRFLATLAASVGLTIIISQIAVLMFGTLPRNIPNVFPGSVEIFGIHTTTSKLVLMGLGVSITLMLFWVHEKTNLGRAMRAISFDPAVAALQGVNFNLINQTTFGIATALAGFAGGIIAPTYGMNTQMGTTVILMVLMMVLLGGMDSLTGAVVGGLVVGEILSFGQFFIGSSIQIVLFVIIGIVLYFRPWGLMGKGLVDMDL